MIDVGGLDKTFYPGTPNARHALRSLSLRLEEADFAVVIGANGAGKSTLLNAIAGEVSPDAGTVSIDGTDVTRWATHRRAGLVSRVFQDPLAGSAGGMTIEENLALALARGRRRSLRFALTEPRRQLIT
jgi:ABC-type uncharacterized transport system, ATPase component